MLNGAGVRTKVDLQGLRGSLYLPAKATTPAAVLAKAPRRIQMNLLRNLSADQLVDALVDGLKDNNTPAELAAVKAQTDQLVSIMKAFSDGEGEGRGHARLRRRRHASIGLNGAAKGTIPGEAFNRALTKVWLGDNPVQGDLKKAMLGG